MCLCVRVSYFYRASYNICRESVLVRGCSLHGQLDNRQVSCHPGTYNIVQ